MAERVEWVVVAKKGAYYLYHHEGAQSVFGLTTARKVAKQLGPPWEVRKASTLELPQKD